MPKSKHRRKKGVGRALTPAQRDSRLPKVTNAHVKAAVVTLVLRKCKSLFSEEPPDGYSLTQMDAAMQQLQDEGELPPFSEAERM